MTTVSPDGAPPSSAKLAELAVATGRTVQDLNDEAVDRIYRIYIGDPPGNGPKESTAPFSKEYSVRPAEVVVRQVDPARFELREPFKYVDENRRFVVPMGDISDFASVPAFLTWLVPRYGRHTLAALLHDHLQHHLSNNAETSPTDPERVTSEEADTIFREALQYSRVPHQHRITKTQLTAQRHSTIRNGHTHMVPQAGERRQSRHPCVDAAEAAQSGL